MDEQLNIFSCYRAFFACTATPPKSEEKENLKPSINTLIQLLESGYPSEVQRAKNHLLKRSKEAIPV